jgi:hypothetical protein
MYCKLAEIKRKRSRSICRSIFWSVLCFVLKNKLKQNFKNNLLFNKYGFYKILRAILLIFTEYYFFLYKYFNQYLSMLIESKNLITAILLHWYLLYYFEYLYPLVMKTNRDICKMKTITKSACWNPIEKCQFFIKIKNKILFHQHMRHTTRIR